MRSFVVAEFQLFDDLFGINVTGESSHSDGCVLERGVVLRQDTVAEAVDDLLPRLS